MLTRMESQDPICSEADFRQSLRAAIQVKNSLSRVKGFTPEQAVLGKMRHLPGSLISDDQAANHALADSNLSEGVARRAMLRRSRPACQKFSPGDWILYWRRQKGGNRGRGERGRWYGPAQVVCGDDRVVWVSHCGHLIRAAPEQLRSASLREWQAIQGQTIRERNVSEVGAATRQVVDLIGKGGFPSKHEISLAVSLDLEEPVDPSQVPLPDDGDEEDILFGDTECFLPHASDKQVWELKIRSPEVLEEHLPSPQQAIHFVMLASEERKKRVEVKLRDCNPADRALFAGAKGKEVSAWITIIRCER